jgi:hypothetical protein
MDKEQLNQDVNRFLRNRHRQLQKDAALKPNKLNTFQWDYSYIPWKDWPVEMRRESVRNASTFGRTWMYGRTCMVADVFKNDARKMYNENWDGCRDLWKEEYRRRKLYRNMDRPIVPEDPIIAEAERKYREREQAYEDRFNQRQQERYKRWQKRFIDIDTEQT